MYKKKVDTLRELVPADTGFARDSLRLAAAALGVMTSKETNGNDLITLAIKNMGRGSCFIRDDEIFL